MTAIPNLNERAGRRGPSVRGLTNTAGEVSVKVAERLVTLLTPTSFEADQYRVLRHRIEQIRGREPSVIGVTSPVPGDGKTTTAINLAGALAQSREKRVLLVDTDLRRSSLGAQLGMAEGGGPGLVEAILDDRLRLDEVARRHPLFNLWVLPTGRHVESPYETLQSPRLTDLLEEARLQFDHVILDTPPVVPVPDCRSLAGCVDGFVLVVSAHRTPRALLEEALNAMEPGKVVGIVFNNADRPGRRRYRDYYGYYYGGAPRKSARGVVRPAGPVSRP